MALKVLRPGERERGADALLREARAASALSHPAIALELLGRREEAFEALEAAARVRRAYTLRRAEREPDLAGLRADPRFAGLLSGKPA